MQLRWSRKEFLQTAEFFLTEKERKSVYPNHPEAKIEEDRENQGDVVSRSPRKESFENKGVVLKVV